MSPSPQLLVSVRNADEAVAALEGGVDLLDIKEPDRGPLGMAVPDVWSAILRERDATAPSVPVSLALGELSDWQHGELPSIPSGVRFVKLGLSRTSGTDWRTEWLRLRSRTTSDTTTPPEWVPVGYADAELVAAPPVDEVLRFALETEGVPGLLIDTAVKNERRLTDWLPSSKLRAIRDELRLRHRFLAVAGRLRTSEFTVMSEVAPAIIAIRSAGCVAGDRSAPVDADRVREAKTALQRCSVGG